MSPPRKLRVLIITMGGERKRRMEELFADPAMAEHFEPPQFSLGVPSRSLRNRCTCLRAAHAAGLIPDGPEWDALARAAAADPDHLQRHADTFFDCLRTVPVTPGRRGSRQDVAVHYSQEFWRKAKSLNRGRAVLACFLAHLIALKEFVAHDMDVLLEDNVRLPVRECAFRIRESREASEEWCRRDGIQCHYRYVGFLGSVTNMQWMHQFHIPRTAFHRVTAASETPHYTVLPFPTTQDIEQSLTMYSSKDTPRKANLGNDSDGDDKTTSQHLGHSRPGGNPVWGCYAYWISKDAYYAVLAVLQQDVGALLWKGKRNRHYNVKPVDKVLPRQIMSLFGPTSVHLPTHAAAFRAPMLTSKIHTQWDPEFCRSTEYQLEHTGLTWSDLWLTESEKSVVSHHERHGEWLTPKALDELGTNDIAK